MRKYRGFELRETHGGVYGVLERRESSVLTPVCETRTACRRLIDAFYKWEAGMHGGK